MFLFQLSRNYFTEGQGRLCLWSHREHTPSQDWQTDHGNHTWWDCLLRVLLKSIILGTFYSSQDSWNLMATWEVSEFSNQTVKFQKPFGTTKFWSCRKEIITWNVQFKDTASLCRHWCWDTHRNTEGSPFVPSGLARGCLCTSGAKPDGQRVQHCLLVFSHRLRGEDELQVPSNLNSLVILWLLNEEGPIGNGKSFRFSHRIENCWGSVTAVSSRPFREQLPAKQTLKDRIK